MSAKFTDGERWIYQRDDGENGEIFYALHRASDYEFIANIYGDETRARLIAAAPDYDDVAGPAITALAFAQEDAQRRGDAIAFAQYTAAKDGLIAAQSKARGREPEMLDITPSRAAIAKATLPS